MDHLELWRRYKKHLCTCPSVGLKLDISRLKFGENFFKSMEPKMSKAYEAMTRLEAGEIANPDEQRMVGHYWLRAPGIAPNNEITQQIDSAIESVTDFATAVHKKKITPPQAGRFTDLVVVGIGGSALGPQLVADALGTKRDKMHSSLY